MNKEPNLLDEDAVKERHNLGIRIKSARKSLRITRMQAASVIGIAPSTLQTWESGNREPSTIKLAMFSRYYGISIQWLIFGEEPMMERTEGPSTIVPTCQAENRLSGMEPPSPPQQKEYYFPSYYSASPSAGKAHFDGTLQKHRYTIGFQAGWIEHVAHTAPDSLSLLVINDDSMQGVMNYQDIALINQGDTTPTDGLFALDINDVPVIKRLQLLPDKRIRIISANPDYQDLDIPLDSPNLGFRIIGRVIWHSHFL